MNRKVIVKLVMWLLLLGTCIRQCTGFTANAQELSDIGQTIVKPADFGLKNPVIEADTGMEAKQKVTWDCVWFGSYPQAEVVASKEKYTALDKELLRDGDIIADSILYSNLKNASGWDANNDITLNGEKYRRIRVNDATNTNEAGDSHHYKWQDANTYHYFRYEPMKWRVLKTENQQALLLSDVVLDDKSYNSEWTSVTWKESTIRSWLNGYGSAANKYGTDYSSGNFISSAFSPAQKSAIIDTNNPDTGTEDKIFYLSESEVYGDKALTYGFAPRNSTYDEARCCKSSTYAKAMGAYISQDGTFRGNCGWWLRWPGDDSYHVPYVHYMGEVYQDGNKVEYYDDSVRAALNLNLSSDEWSYAGTVCSDGTLPEGYKSLEDAAVTFTSHEEQYYTGQPQRPEFTVSYQGEKLTEGRDYSVSCTNNINPSLNPYCYECYGGIYDSKNREKYAKISITGIYPYKSTIERYFLIRGFFDLTVIRGMDYWPDYTGGEICPKPEVLLYNDGTMEAVLTENVDYRLSYYDNTEPGKATVVVTGIGKYQGYGSYHIHFFISEKDISKGEVLLSADGKTYERELPEDTYTADGKAKTPDVHVTWVIQKDGSYEPIDSSYYDVAYENNVNAGTATVRITGKSPYTGSLIRTFQIGQGTNADGDDGNRFTYRFGNTEEDFGYQPGYKIDEESIFTKLWGNTALAQQNYEYWTKKVGTWNGNCYGMSATSIMFNDNRDDIEISGFNPGAAFVKELELNDYNRNSNIRMSLLDFIEVMQVSQTDETIAEMIGATNKGRINWLCSALKSAETDQTAIIIVLDSNGPQGAHALVGYHMEDVSETERRIYVYDCNHPNANRYITLTMENGACTGWRYEGGNGEKSLRWTSEQKGDVSCTISYISYDSFVKVWLNRSLEEKPEPGRNVMTLNVANASICDKTGQEVAVLEDGEIHSEHEEIFSYYPVCARLDGTYDKSEIQPVIYLPTDEYTVKNTDENENELKLTMCNVDRKISVVTSAASLTVNVSDISKVNMIQVEGEGEKVEADFYSSDASEQYKSMNYIGSVIGSSLMKLGASAGEKVMENFDVTSEKEENKDPEEEPGDKGDKEEDPGDKKADSEGKKEDPDNKNDNSGSKNDSPANKNETPADNVSFKLVSSTGSNKIAAGKKVKLTAVTTPQNAAKQKLSYSSSNKKAATVSSTGTVSVKKNAGGKTVVITAVNQAGRKASIKLKIMKGAVKKIQITGKNSCKAGKSLKLKAKVTAGKGANKSIIWKSSNTRYAEVTKTGTVKTKKKGKGKQVKITAAAADGSGKKGTITIKIK